MCLLPQKFELGTLVGLPQRDHLIKRRKKHKHVIAYNNKNLQERKVLRLLNVLKLACQSLGNGKFCEWQTVPQVLK